MIIDELFETPQRCPECGGISFSNLILAEKKDACYYKIKASAKVWPSAYASGRLVQCRKKGAANYGNKNEGVAEEWSKKYKSSINCSHPKGFSQKAHCAGKKKNNESVETEAVVEALDPIQQKTDQMQQSLLDRMGARFGLPPGSTMDQVQAAQQAHLNKNDPAAAAQYKQNMTNIDAGNTAANKPMQLAPKALGADFTAGLAAQKAGASPTEIMLAQPGIASNQKYLDAIAPTLGLPAGSSVEKLQAVAKQRAAGKGPAEQQAIDDMAKRQGLPMGLTKDQFYKAYQEKLQSSRQLPAPASAPAPTPAAPPSASAAPAPTPTPQQQAASAAAKKQAPYGYNPDTGQPNAAPVTENKTRAVDDKGRTQQQWIQAVKKKFPNAKIVQAKMIDGPCQAILPDGRKLSWNKVEQAVAEEYELAGVGVAYELGRRAYRERKTIRDNPYSATKQARKHDEWEKGLAAGRYDREDADQFRNSVREQGVAENAGQPLSIQQLATISDAALDDAYGYGRSTPGNTFGWQANLKSAAYAKQMIDQGVTDIEAISDAIHKGWNTTAQAFVQDPEQFDDTAKLAAAGKLEAKLQQRAQLMKQNYGQLPEEEKEKDRVVARALLQAIRGKQGVAEGQLELNTPDPVVVVQDLKGNILDKINLSVAAQKYKLGQPQNIKNQLAHQNYTKVGNYTIVSPMSGQPQDQTTIGQKSTFATTEGEQQPGADYRDPKEVDYDSNGHDDMVARVRKLAGLGPMKTTYDPAKRQYRNMPTAQQPKK